MGKEEEIKYYSRLGEEGQRHADGKPFSDSECGGLLIDIGQVMNLLPSVPARVLDVGCGTGWTSEFLAKAGYTVTGLDISPDMIQASRRLRSAPGLEFVVGDFEKIPQFAPFDAVVSFGALHHSGNVEAAFVSCRKALKEGGSLVLLEPGEGHEEAETSRQYVEEFGLTERSLPPAVISNLLQSLNFHDIKMVPRFSILDGYVRTPSTEKNWKYAIISRIVGKRLADCLQGFSSSRKVAIIAARR